MNPDRWRAARHLAYPACYLYLLGAAASEWLPKPPLWEKGIVTVITAAMLVGVIKHARELCERCLAHMPLDPDKAVQRNRPFLRLTHNIRWIAFPYLAAVVASIALPSHWLAAKVVATIGPAISITWIYTATRHQRLQPWCPWCRDDGGDDDSETAPTGPGGLKNPIPA